MIYTLTLNPSVDRELSVSRIDFDTVLRAPSTRVDWGGKGINVSRMLKSLGLDSTVLGTAGGKMGEMLRDGVEALGIHTDFVCVEGDTRSNVSIVAQEPYHYIKVNEPGPFISPAQVEQLVAKAAQLTKPGDWWVLSGSLLPGMPVDIYARLIRTINQAGAKAILDAEGETLRLGCEAKPFLVKPNHVEAAKLTAMPTETVEEAAQTARHILSLGPEEVVISMGEVGAVLANRAGAWLVHTPKIQMRNPIGAGDSLVGGLVFGLVQSNAVLNALEWGVACGAAAASLSGTEIGSKELVEQLLKKVYVTTLAG
jgi:1-phosphofructokinase family hexose kinase